MHIHVSLINDRYLSTCSKCEAYARITKFHIFAGTGHSVSPAFCNECMPDEIAFDVEQADMTPDKQAPGKKTKRLSQKQERRIAEDIGGRTQPGSGNQAHAKGDVRKKGEFRVEAKFTKSKQFILKREELDKISGECAHKEKPVFQIDFRNSTTSKVEDSWVAIPYLDWLEMVNK